MKKYILLLLTNILFFNFLSANRIDSLPEFNLLKEEVKEHLFYIASDELQGRKTGSKGNDLAAEYIANEFEKYGLQKADSLDSWYQPVPFRSIKPVEEGSLEFDGETYFLNDKLLITNGVAFDQKAEAVFAGYGWVDEKTDYNDYKDLDVKGKIVFVLPGNPETSQPFSAFSFSPQKRKFAAENGAIALIELYRLNFPFHYFKRYFTESRMEVSAGDEQDESFVYGWLKETSKEKIAEMKNGKKTMIHLKSSGLNSEKIYSNNVIGMLEGTDSLLKNEYIILTAHHDHVGTEPASKISEDTIFNGARDNAMGVVALLSAAKSLAAHPPKRSVIFATVTAEEMGMLGSQYYVDNPVIPLEKTIFNLNNDGGGYNSTEHYVVIGYGRTGTDEEIKESGKISGLKLAANPMPEQGLFDRSDNVSFARKGIPCLDFAPGALTFDEEVTQYYHQTADNPENVDLDYLLKFCKSYARAARLIADKEERPKWKAGDKYEEAGKALYELKD